MMVGEGGAGEGLLAGKQPGPDWGYPWGKTETSCGRGYGVWCCVQGWRCTGPRGHPPLRVTDPGLLGALVPRPWDTEKCSDAWIWKLRPRSTGRILGTLGRAVLVSSVFIPPAHRAAGQPQAPFPGLVHGQAPEPARRRTNPAQPCPPTDPGSYFPFVPGREGCDSSTQQPRAPKARPLHPPPRPQAFLRGIQQCNRLLQK